MILTVTPHPALDVTYEVDALVVHGTHRVRTVREVAGGKGVNVASVLHRQGAAVLATGALAGPVGEVVRADLDARGIPHDFVEVGSATRRTLTVVDHASGDATAFNETGSAWAEGDWAALVAHVEGLLASTQPRVLVASGSVPPGFPGDGYATLVRLGHAAGCRVVIDASGDALVAGVAARPDLVKPNVHELRAATGLEDVFDGAKSLQDLGARHVLVSLGPDGMVLVVPGGEVLRAAPGETLRGNPTGAGDAAVAAVAAGLDAGAGWPDLLADAVAWSGAAVLQPVAGMVDPDDVHRLRASVRSDPPRS